MNAQDSDRKDAIASQQPCSHASTQQQLAAVGITSQTNEKPSANSSRSSLTPQPKWMTLELEERGWRRIVQNFTPSWFAVNMATGMVCLVLHAIPYKHRVITVIYTVLFVINVILFAIISFTSLLRYVMYPATWGLMLRHPVQSLFLGCIPMGLTTIINMFIFVCIQEAGWGPWANKLAWVLWWIDVVMAIACACGLPFLMTYVHPTSLSTMTAAWLLPAATPIVTSANGATVASILSNPQHALWTIIVSYVLWGIGLPMALLTLVIYFHRLAMHKLPPREVIVSVFLPLGPLGQGGFSIMNLGKMALEVFPKTGTLHPMAGEILYVSAFFTAIVLWGFGIVWAFFAVASISRSKFPFNMGWWGFTFPTGVFVLSTLQMGEELPSAFFQVLGTVTGVAVIILWFLVAIVTIRRAIAGDVFFAPCLQKVDKANAPGANGSANV
ncbi:uncharacterized protein K452DRAFT_233711 [Aplosporella prunicola CBS 121167]|uniref:Sulfite efflux pump SSU1 n=1 Tax=Aplosporella prunicola CBS 121167 TaxID=1176127 RepID=A0A6A6B7M5_9PEZI|nr:uncharacterized protein K452DRAFT_233711 [Aplosporella prunicola CBS 121167]KAF2138781.1 hypothetical protein K452DRAFT_233711 [Aplosporella prunicola CBS 121167]